MKIHPTDSRDREFRVPVSLVLTGYLTVKASGLRSAQKKANALMSQPRSLEQLTEVTQGEFQVASRRSITEVGK